MAMLSPSAREPCHLLESPQTAFHWWNGHATCRGERRDGRAGKPNGGDQEVRNEADTVARNEADPMARAVARPRATARFEAALGDEDRGRRHCRRRRDVR